MVRRFWPSLMFGTPSGVVLSPQDLDLLRRAWLDLPVEQGYVVASLDPALPTHIGRPQLHRLVEAVAVAEVATGPMRLVEEAQALAGRGLAGDRYAEKTGPFIPSDGAGSGYDLTLIQAERSSTGWRREGPTARLSGGGHTDAGLAERIIAQRSSWPISSQ